MTIATGEVILASDVNVIANGRAKISSGTYSGNGSANRAIPHGLGVTPKLVVIFGTNNDFCGGIIIGNTAQILGWSGGSNAGYAVTISDATNFYVGNGTNYELSLNSVAGARTYTWTAISDGA